MKKNREMESIQAAAFRRLIGHLQKNTQGAYSQCVAGVGAGLVFSHLLVRDKQVDVSVED